MRLILLPAFDGTGAMFRPFIESLNGAFDTVPVSYPEAGPQDYDSLARHIEERVIGDQDFLVLGESFAGPLAYRLALSPAGRCRGAVFVATYLTNPSPWVSKLLGALPARLSSRFVSTGWVIGKIALSPAADPSLARVIAANFGSVKAHAIRRRLRTIGSLGALPDRPLSLPCLYIQANKDKLVPAARLSDFEALCPDLEVQRVEGGHFVVQESPRECARIVIERFRNTH